LPKLVPSPPPSPFVARLRGEVSASRGGDGGHGGLLPACQCGRRRGGDAAGRRVSFGEAEVTEVEDDRPRSWPPVCIELKIKGTAAKPFTLESVDTRTTTLELKAQCQLHCPLAPEQMRLLHKGKLLQDDQSLESLSIPNRAALFLVKGAVAKPVAEPAAEAPSASASSASTEPQPPPAAAVARRTQDLEDDEEDEEEFEMEQLRNFLMRGSHTPMCWECGVNPGRLQTNGLCGICWREQVVRENKELKRRREEAKLREEENRRREEEERRQAEEYELRRQKDTSRCYECHKRVGLTGFLCQCGYVFCAKHRYAEEHNCTFDYSKHGKELLAQQVRSSQ